MVVTSSGCCRFVAMDGAVVIAVVVVVVSVVGITRAAAAITMVVPSAKGVDGVYDSDPQTNPDAKRFDELSYDEVLQRDLKVADATAISLCRDNKLPIVVFNLLEEGNIERAVRGEKIGTLVH